ncbi:MAG: hypothetical protein R2745_01380 [Vicinamibacterales bacterium]
MHVGLACPNAYERRTFAAWLADAGMEVTSLVEACRVESDGAATRLDCIVADADLLASGVLASLRRHAPRVPVVAVANAGVPVHGPSGRSASVTVVTRPIDAPALALAVSLAHGEARQGRRHARKPAAAFPAHVSDVDAEILDVSHDGVRIEIARTHAARLGPQFRLRVPMVALDIVVRRAWVGRGRGARVQCGARLGTLTGPERLAWDRVLELAGTPAPAGARGDARTAVAPGARRRLLGTVSDLLSTSSLMNTLANPLARLRA